MNHPISTADWIDYTDGTLTARQRRRVEAHLQECRECRDLARQLSAVEEFLTATGASATEVSTVSAAELGRKLDVFVAELEAQDLISARLARAQTLLAGICGAHVTDQVLRTAAHRASARSPERMTEHDWPDFLSHLTGIMTSMCGKPAANALWECLAR